MSVSEMRSIAIVKGYVIKYTFGVTEKAKVFSWNPHRPSFEVDMGDPVKGSRKLEEIVLNL